MESDGGFCPASESRRVQSMVSVGVDEIKQAGELCLAVGEPSFYLNVVRLLLDHIMGIIHHAQRLPPDQAKVKI